MTTATFGSTRDRGGGLFLGMAIALAVINVAGFSLHFGMGRSTFAAPWTVHLHAIVFFGWIVFYVLQSALATTGSIALHRRLGWIGAFWVAAIVAIGIVTTIIMVRRGTTPFFFLPGYFLFMNSLTAICFAALMTAAIRLRRRTDWHRRLITVAMAGLSGPAIGRLLPMPLMIPWAAWGVFATIMMIVGIAIVLDARRGGRVHPAWLWGIAALTMTQVAMDVLATSAPGLALYGQLTAGTPGAAVPPLAYPAPPPGMSRAP